MGCPNKSAIFKVHAFVVLLGWRHWKFNVCHLSLLRLKVMESYSKEQRVIIVKTHYRYWGNGKLPCHLTQWRSALATEFVRFDTVRLLSFGRVCEISCLCQQTTNNSWAQGGDSTCHWRNGATIMRKCHREFRQKSKSLPAESWGEIFRILCSTINGSVCTLQWNKIIGTFWLNVSFYYEIKSYALVGTPYTCNIKIYRHYA